MLLNFINRTFIGTVHPKKFIHRSKNNTDRPKLSLCLSTLVSQCSLKPITGNQTCGSPHKAKKSALLFQRVRSKLYTFATPRFDIISIIDSIKFEFAAKETWKYGTIIPAFNLEFYTTSVTSPTTFKACPLSPWGSETLIKHTVHHTINQCQLKSLTTGLLGNVHEGGPGVLLHPQLTLCTWHSFQFIRSMSSPIEHCDLQSVCIR